MKFIDFTLLIFVKLLINSDEILIFSLTTNLIICAFLERLIIKLEFPGTKLVEES